MGVQAPVFAVVTPFTSQGGIDAGAMRDYLRFLTDAGVASIIAGGTTGEFASLSLAERKAVLECCRQHYAGTIIAHISACCVADSRELLAHAADRADAALLLAPYYFAKPEEAGVLQFVREVVRESSFPFYLYNFPEHTQFAMTPQFYRRVADECEGLAGIKDSGGNIEISKGYKAAVGAGQVIVGSDRRALQVLESGLDGSVTGAGNPVPELLEGVARHFAAGDLASAQRSQQLLDRWTDFRERIAPGDLAIVKAALGERIPGFPARVRPPFVELDEAAVKRVRAGLRECLAATA